MAKPPIKPKEITQERILDKQQLQWLEEDVEQAGGEEEYLISKGAISMRGGVRSVVMNADGTIPYNQLSKELKQLADYKRRRQAAEDAETLRTTGVDMRKERVNRIFKGFRDPIKRVE